MGRRVKYVEESVTGWIVDYMQQVKRCTRTEIAEQLGVSTDTITNKTKKLKLWYPQIVTKRGKGGGYRWVD